MKIDEIENKVFKLYDINDYFKNEAHGSNDHVDKEQDNLVISKNCRYVQIKRLAYKSNKRDHEFIQIIDISAQVLYQLAHGERELYTMISAMVSHELRNPLNSIKIQTIRLKMLTDKMKEILQNEKKLKLHQLKRKFSRIHEEQVQINQVQINCQEFLNFLVQDILDLSQINQKKFRKNIQTFDLKNAVNEVINIQKYKSEQLGIAFQVEYINFENNSVLRSSLVERNEDFFVSIDK